MTDKHDPSTEEFFIPDLCNVQAVLFLVLVAELLAIVLELAGSGVKAFSWESFSLTSVFVQWVFLLSAALLCQLRPLLSDRPLAWAAPICYLVILAVVALSSAGGQWLVSSSGLQPRSINYWNLLSHVLICAVLAGIVLRYFYLTQQLRLRQRAELQARIQALQSRIRPHFLFNSMNIIASLIAVDQEAAERAVEDLAGLFRASLTEAQTEVSLAEELELCRRYARLEGFRLGARLTMDWQVDPALGQLPIPSLCLQPLVENAIYHGIQQLPDGGTVTIKADYQQGVLTLEVINPMIATDRQVGVAREDESSSGNQLAQDNIALRLQALYGSRASLTTRSLDSDKGRQYCAVISYPVSGSMMNNATSMRVSV